MSIRCSGCGKKIPSYGQVCPHCHRDKSGYKVVEASAMVCGSIGGGIGWLIGGFGGFLVGMILGVIIGTIIGMMTNKGAGKAPPVVRIGHSSGVGAHYHRPLSARPEPKDETRERLAKLEKLRVDGSITEAEYADRRSGIISSI